jgi:quinol-cytochrome oxidoreductase complex cytochrome b subunit
MIGPDTLPKWYALHMLLLPGAIMALIGLHLYLVVRLGVTSPPWSRTAAGRERDEAATGREGLIREPAVDGESA